MSTWAPFADDIFKCILLNEYLSTLFYWRFVHKGSFERSHYHFRYRQVSMNIDSSALQTPKQLKVGQLHILGNSHNQPADPSGHDYVIRHFVTTHVQCIGYASLKYSVQTTCWNSIGVYMSLHVFICLSTLFAWCQCLCNIDVGRLPNIL